MLSAVLGLIREADGAAHYIHVCRFGRMIWKVVSLTLLVSAKGLLWHDFLTRALGESQTHPGCVATNLFPHFLALLKTEVGGFGGPGTRGERIVAMWCGQVL